MVAAPPARAPPRYSPPARPPAPVIEFIPEMGALLQEINDLLASGVAPTPEAVGDALSANSSALFAYLPAVYRRQLLADRDPHGNVQVQ